MQRLSRLFGVLAMLTLWIAAIAPASAAPVSGSYFGNTWAYTDQPVATGLVNRTWMWGPSADSPALLEPYAESSSGQRTVQYFDKTRMEITHPDGDTSSIWYVSNGLLAEELTTGRLQLGDNSFEQHDPAQINVAGDANDPNGPTYATFNKLMSYGAIPSGWIINQTVDRAGNVGTSDSVKSYNVTANDVGAPTNHNVASVFWDFMNSSGTVYANGTDVQGQLFTNPFYATGYPLTEAYWTNVLVGRVSKQVLVQVFERRVLTYTPSNPDGWKVEAGNVGQHYYTWRYTDLGRTVKAAPNPPTPPTPPAPPVTASAAAKYVGANVGIAQDFVTSLSTASALLNDPTGTSAWFSAFDSEMTQWDSFGARQLALVPPPGYEAYQTDMLTTWLAVDHAADDYTNGYNDDNPYLISVGNSELQIAESDISYAFADLPGLPLGDGLLAITAVCNDGQLSLSSNVSGTCSSDGGVYLWVKKPTS